MTDQTGNGSNYDQALEEIKKSMDEAITRTEDAMEDAMEKAGIDASAAAHVAEEYRLKVFEYMRANVNAALDYASGLAGMKSPLDLASTAREAGAPMPSAELSAASEAIEAYRQRMFQFMKENINAAMDYAEGLAAVRSPSEFIELSTSHARKQFEAVTAQTTELGMLAQRLAVSNSDAFGGISKMFGQQPRT
ncbi:Phasin 2 [Rhodovulum sp. PH10]|uniref:phasin family protein n=1 Tax=Rhodovulum sp. PH10 TaxID=1187851 RepID=UPI00027C2413|nr:phasin family protein [Rhodovulum sp. PH10]EJW09414.1 Phasin 2 [Rhodovulum sp. PH10]